jgi:hypothetical protein
MPETPDFDKIALAVGTAAGRGDVLPHIKDALRLVWNARGAADAAQIRSDFAVNWGLTLIDSIRRAIKKLDR